MSYEEEIQYIILEIPEYETSGTPSSIFYFNIYGINSEKPLIRLDNFIFEGKWYNCSNSPNLFSSCIQEKIEKICNTNLFVLSENSSCLLDSTKLSIIQISQFETIPINFVKKRLRLHRIPLLVCFD
jgi:hypothetical protein